MLKRNSYLEKLSNPPPPSKFKWSVPMVPETKITPPFHMGHIHILKISNFCLLYPKLEGKYGSLGQMYLKKTFKGTLTFLRLNNLHLCDRYGIVLKCHLNANPILYIYYQEYIVIVLGLFG